MLNPYLGRSELPKLACAAGHQGSYVSVVAGLSVALLSLRKTRACTARARQQSSILELSPYPADRLIRDRIARWIRQPPPTAYQCLVANIDLGSLLKRSRRIRHKEITSAASESLNDCNHWGTLAAGHGDEFGKIAGMADRAALGIGLREAAEQPLGRFDVHRIASLDFRQDFIRMPRKGTVLALDSLKIGHSNGPTLAGPMALPSVGAGTHQGMLEDRERIFFPPGSEEQAIADCGSDLTAVELGRLVDGSQEAEVVQPGEKVLARVDRLGETLEASALAQIVRAHSENDEKVRGRAFLARQGTEQLGQEFGLFAAPFLGISKQLLELVDEEAQ